MTLMVCVPVRYSDLSNFTRLSPCIQPTNTCVGSGGGGGDASPAVKGIGGDVRPDARIKRSKLYIRYLI